MAYLLIIREPRGQRAQRSEEEGREAYAAMLRFGEGLAKRGILVAAESLRDDAHGVRVRIRDGNTDLMDGPFTESKEMVGGFFLIDVNSRHEAVEIAAQCPAARFATVEVRELAPLQRALNEAHVQTNHREGSSRMNTTPNTVAFVRVIKSPPERLYRAFTDPDAKVRWEPPFGFIGKVHEWDLRVGGRYRMSFTNFSTGTTHRFGGEFLEIVENERLVVSDAFDDPNLQGSMRTSVHLRPVLNGTELTIEQTGIPAAIPLEFCYAGWQESMVQLAQLVEAEVPDAPTE